MTDHAPMHYMRDRKEMAYTLQTPFCKADYRPLSVQFLNSTQDRKILMMVLEAVRDVASGADRHLDITFTFDCRYRVVESSSLVSILSREAFSHPNIPLFSFTSKWFLCYIVNALLLSLELHCISGELHISIMYNCQKLILI